MSGIYYYGECIILWKEERKDVMKGRRERGREGESKWKKYEFKGS